MSPKQASGTDAAVEVLNRKYGAGAVMRLSNGPVEKVRTVPTGSLGLDMALGINGYPCGRIVEIYGPESAGKSTMVLQAIAATQKIDPEAEAVYVDAEHALDRQYALALGVDDSRLYICQPSCGEEGLDIVETFCANPGKVRIVVVDSVAALVPRAEVEGEIGDAFVGLQARMMSQALRKIGNVLKDSSGPVVLFINQLRDKIGVAYGNPETTPGGRALKFWASVRVEVRKGEAIKNGSSVIGTKIKFKVVKNKLAPPFRTAEADMIYGAGVCAEGELLDLAVSCGLVTRSGASYALGDRKLGQGREAAVCALRTDSALQADLDGAVRRQVKEC